MSRIGLSLGGVVVLGTLFSEKEQVGHDQRCRFT